MPSHPSNAHQQTARSHADQQLAGQRAGNHDRPGQPAAEQQPVRSPAPQEHRPPSPQRPAAAAELPKPGPAELPKAASQPPEGPAPAPKGPGSSPPDEARLPSGASEASEQALTRSVPSQPERPGGDPAPESTGEHLPPKAEQAASPAAQTRSLQAAEQPPGAGQLNSAVEPSAPGEGGQPETSGNLQSSGAGSTAAAAAVAAETSSSSSEQPHVHDQGDGAGSSAASVARQAADPPVHRQRAAEDGQMPVSAHDPCQQGPSDAADAAVPPADAVASQALAHSLGSQAGTPHGQRACALASCCQHILR